MTTLKEFIEHTLINDTRDIQQKYNYHYLSFGLIAQGIEFLGCCLDSNGYFDEKLSGTRFRNTINILFPDSYKKINIKNSSYDLFRDLRCGLLHVCLPKPNIEIIQRREICKFGNHLEIKNIRDKNNILILVSEDLFEDFESACRKIILKIENGEIEDRLLLLTEP
jgi:hypothetical protein